MSCHLIIDGCCTHSSPALLSAKRMRWICQCTCVHMLSSVHTPSPTEALDVYHGAVLSLQNQVMSALEPPVLTALKYQLHDFLVCGVTSLMCTCVSRGVGGRGLSRLYDTGSYALTVWWANCQVKTHCTCS
jgi:hypothetical protein